MISLVMSENIQCLISMIPYSILFLMMEEQQAEDELNLQLLPHTVTLPHMMILNQQIHLEMLTKVWVEFILTQLYKVLAFSLGVAIGTALRAQVLLRCICIDLPVVRITTLGFGAPGNGCRNLKSEYLSF